MKSVALFFALAVLIFATGCGVGGMQTTGASRGTFSATSAEPAMVAFSSDRDGNGLMELYYMKWDGSNQTKIPLPADYSGRVWDPAMSPDGTRIVFTYFGPDFADIYSVDLDGLNLKAVTSGADSFGPRFSPDGSKIAFIRYTEDYVAHVWLMNSDGTNQVDITPSSATDYDSAGFSADGTKIVASRDANMTGYSTKSALSMRVSSMKPSLAAGEPGHEVVSMNLDGGNLTVLATEADEAGAPQFSEDGSKLIFTARAQMNQVVSESIADHLRTALTPADSNSFDAQVVGSYIYFVSDRDGNTAVYRMNPDGTNAIRLTDPAQNSSLGRAVH